MSTTTLTDTPRWVETYLTQLALHGMEHTAAAEAGTTVRAVRKLIEEDREFAYAVEDALERSADFIEREVRRRAIEGIDKGIYYKGKLKATEKQYSDSLLITLIKAKRRREFGDKQEITGPGGGPLIVNIRTFGPGPTAIDDTVTVASLVGEDPPVDVSFHELDVDAAADLV